MVRFHVRSAIYDVANVHKRVYGKPGMPGTPGTGQKCKYALHVI